MKREHSHTRQVSTYQNPNMNAGAQVMLGDTPTTKSGVAETARVLILGTNNTGKTSIFKQIREFCGDHPVQEDEYRVAKKDCVEHVLQIIAQLAKASINLTLQGHKSTQVLEKTETSLLKYSSLNFGHKEQMWNQTLQCKYDDPRLLMDLEQFLTDPGIQSTMLYSQNSLINNAEWFLSKMSRFFEPVYIPDFSDYVRLQTGSGVSDEVSRLSNSWNLSITDVSGTRSQRTLWASVLDPHYTAILFVASLADFDQYTEINSEQRVNKLIESMELLHSLTSLSYFENTNIILILNQKDVFDRKLHDMKISFAEHFPLHLASRFYYENRDIEYRDSIYDRKNDVRFNKPKSQHNYRYQKNEAYIAFDVKRERDSNYCIDIVKKQFTEILPPHLQKTLRIYITCAIATQTFGYVLQTLTQEIIHMEQMRKVRESRR